MLARVVDRIVRATPRDVAPAQVVLYGSRATGSARPESDVDILVLVAPPRTMGWQPRDNVRLRSALYLALSAETPSVDIQVRTIDQYAEASAVPVCPEHAAAAHGVLLWTSTWTREPVIRRTSAAVHRDNMIEWLRFAGCAEAALRATSETAVRDTRARRHYERSVRASLVAFALATGAPIPDHTAPLATLERTLGPAFAPIFVLASRDDTLGSYRRAAVAAYVVASAAVTAYVRAHRD